MSTDSNKRSATGKHSSNKASKSNGGSSPSAGSTPENGFNNLNGKLRSCLRHPLALPLIRLLSDNDGKGCPISEKYKRDEVINNAREEGKGAFSNAVNGWNGEKECDLTDNFLHKELNTMLKKSLGKRDETQEHHDSYSASQCSVQSDTSLAVKNSAQTFVTGLNEREKQRGFIDTLLWERKGKEVDSNIAHPVALMEFGLGSKYSFWEKVSQGLVYVKICRNSELKKSDQQDITLYSFEEYPMLLSSIILNKNKKTKEVDGDFGTFLCIPVSSSKDGNGKGDFRVVLLHKARVDNLDAASEEFGKIVQASMALRKWRKENPNLDFEYLGPNCAKVGDRLYRSYDTRLRCTNRSPDLYLSGFHRNSASDNGGKAVAAVTVFDLVDGEDTLSFGKSLPKGDKERDWLWLGKGRLCVISVPYREGVHCATKLSDFKPILDHLIYLHRKNNVHGDIRAFNIVFSNEHGKPKGWLIDLDFGGEAGKVCYPGNFNFDLVDGTRLDPNKKNAPIQKSHDYYALWQVMTNVHEAYSCDNPELEEKAWNAFTRAKENLQMLLDQNIDLGKPTNDEFQEILKKFLNDWGEIQLRLKRNFSNAIGKQGGTQPTKQQGTVQTSPKKTAETNEKVATGSL